MIRNLVVLGIMLLLTTQLVAQVPFVEGNVSVSLRKTTISCDLQYSQLPAEFVMRINKSITDFEVWVEGKQVSVQRAEFLDSYDGFAYSLPNTTEIERLRVTYTYRQSKAAKRRSRRTDWKGNLAFNRQAFRASEQTEWYPVFVMPDTEVLLNSFAYDLKVACEDCRALFVNGSAPVLGKVGQFESKTPTQLLLFLGNYTIDRSGDVYFLNSPLTATQRSQLQGEMERVTRFYESKLGIPYGGDLTFIETKATALFYSWWFNSYPSIVSVGSGKYGLSGLFEKRPKDQIKPGRLGTLYHEAGHYYFGTFRYPTGPLFWVFLEGFNEYLSAKAMQELQGEAFFRAKLANYVKQTHEKSLMPLSEIQEREQVSVVYRYRYVPLILAAVEKEIGEEMMWKWLVFLLKSNPTQAIEYTFLYESLLACGLDADTLATLEQQYFAATEARANACKALGIVE